MKDAFDQEVNQGQEIPNVPEEEQNQEIQEQSENHNDLDTAEKQVVTETNTGELKIENIIKPGRYGVSNSQMIPALKMAIAEKSIEKLTLLKKSYMYTFKKSIRYLKKAEREFITSSDI